MAHAGYLRDHWEGLDRDFLELVRGLHLLGEEAAEHPPVAGAEHVIAGISELPGLDEVDRAIVAYVARLTLAPRSMRARRVQELRDVGLSDGEIHDVVQVCACFSFMNRLADGTGVTLTERREALARELFGEAVWEAHLAWSRGED